MLILVIVHTNKIAERYYWMKWRNWNFQYPLQYNFRLDKSLQIFKQMQSVQQCSDFEIKVHIQTWKSHTEFPCVSVGLRFEFVRVTWVQKRNKTANNAILFKNLHKNGVFLETLYEFVNELLCTVNFLDPCQSGNITPLSLLVITCLRIKAQSWMFHRVWNKPLKVSNYWAWFFLKSSVHFLNSQKMFCKVAT